MGLDGFVAILALLLALTGKGKSGGVSGEGLVEDDDDNEDIGILTL